MNESLKLLAEASEPPWVRTLYNPFKNQHRSPLTNDPLTHGEAFLFNNPNHASEPDPDVFSESCYICNDPDFAQMGLPLCYPCRFCKGHVAADDSVCDACGKDQEPDCLRCGKDRPDCLCPPGIQDSPRLGPCTAGDCGSKRCPTCLGMDRADFDFDFE